MRLSHFVILSPQKSTHRMGDTYVGIISELNVAVRILLPRHTWLWDVKLNFRVLTFLRLSVLFSLWSVYNLPLIKVKCRIRSFMIDSDLIFEWKSGVYIKIHRGAPSWLSQKSVRDF